MTMTSALVSSTTSTSSRGALAREGVAVEDVDLDDVDAVAVQRRAVTWACAGVGLLRVSMTAVTFPRAPAMSFPPLPLVFGQPPPSSAD